MNRQSPSVRTKSSALLISGDFYSILCPRIEPLKMLFSAIKIMTSAHNAVLLNAVHSKADFKLSVKIDSIR
jgi:hypothetical protein